MKFFKVCPIIFVILSLGGCAVISDVKKYNISAKTDSITNLGVPVKVIQLNKKTLSILNLKKTFIVDKYKHLFQATNNLYTLAEGDVVSIQLWSYPEITPAASYSVYNSQVAESTGYRIDQSGYIQFPLIGKIKASGKSISKLKEDLESSLYPYLKKPDVIVKVLSYESKYFYIHGNVSKRGQYYLTDRPLSLYGALSLSGGVDDNADNTSIQLNRNGISYDLNIFELEENGLSLHNLIIQPNDTIYVNAKENKKIYVIGEAVKNQALSIRDKGISLSNVLGESLGVNPTTANASRIYIFRTYNKNEATIYHMDLSELGNFLVADQFKMQGNDIIYIDQTGLTRWQRVMNQLLPFGTGLTNMKYVCCVSY